MRGTPYPQGLHLTTKHLPITVGWCFKELKVLVVPDGGEEI